MGRPKVDIDWGRVTEMLRAHVPGAAVARVLGIHPNTLYKAIESKFHCNMTQFTQEKKEEGVSLVKESMFRDALSGAHGGVDRIFWLKNNAGWTDKSSISGLPPTIQIALAPNVDAGMAKKIENFFNGVVDDNEGFRKEPDSLPERSEADH
jgi:hypothetical protein